MSFKNMKTLKISYDINKLFKNRLKHDVSWLNEFTKNRKIKDYAYKKCCKGFDIYFNKISHTDFKARNIVFSLTYGQGYVSEFIVKGVYSKRKVGIVFYGLPDNIIYYDNEGRLLDTKNLDLFKIKEIKIEIIN